MKKLYLLLAAIIMVFSTCKAPVQEPEKKSTTVVQHYTFFNTYPLFLNGKVKTVKYRTYWPVNNDGIIEKGALMTKEERDSLKFSYDFIAYYNEDGILEKSETLDGDKVLSYWETTIEGQFIKDAKFYKNDTVRYIHKLEYDENSFMIAADNYRGVVDTLISRFEFISNEDGFMTEAKVIKKGELAFKYVFILDENNRYMEQKNYNKDDSLIFHLTSKYNDKGFIEGWETLVSAKNAGNKAKNEYTAFDDKGNWTSLNYYLNGELATVEELVIEYYED